MELQHQNEEIRLKAEADQARSEKEREEARKKSEEDFQLLREEAIGERERLRKEAEETHRRLEDTLQQQEQLRKANEEMQNRLDATRIGYRYADRLNPDARMLISRGTDVIRCKMFVGTLSEITLEWFSTIPSSTITSFAEFKRAFLERFSANRAKPVMKVVDPNDGLLVKAFVKGLRASSFSESLYRIPPKSLMEIRLAKWAIELSEYSIQYDSGGPIRAQFLADFVVELSDLVKDREKDGSAWILSVDESSNLKGSGAGVVLEGPEGVLIEQSLRFAFKASNNKAEYEALIAGMLLAKEMGVSRLLVKSDSALVTGQVKGEFQARVPQLAKYLEVVQVIAKNFVFFKFVHVPREQNSRADLLSKLVQTSSESWMILMKSYLADGRLPPDEGEASRIKKSLGRYMLIDGNLFRYGISRPLLICVDLKEAFRIMTELHEGICGSHIGGRALMLRVVRGGFYWPTMKQDCMEYVKKCESCQKHSDWSKAPPEVLHSINTPCRVRDFIWKHIICRFGVLRRIISDNGTQFACSQVGQLCEEVGVKHVFSSVEHPQTNGQAETTNKVLLRGIKRRLTAAKGEWPNEIHRVLWAYHTTPKSSTRETPFNLVYGTNAMIPVEIAENSDRVRAFTKKVSEVGLRANLDTLEEAREFARISREAIKRQLERRYRTKVIPRKFQVEDLVL
ncbi:uncharacterized protein LOC114190415 [Vigna unguiculata]|uniref:uncharacterized protein LOC114190415 n=1 Tax=Vigna unguiculata TaxID=3917 RepID=UPI0010160CA3|nr:uncharacterized protein LOC114190415 [Vigna unguiculata]